MALTVAQIIDLSTQEAKCPSFTTQAAQKLNLILQELAQDWNFSTGQGWFSGAFGSGIGGDVHSATVVAGSGPYQLPTDFLRMDFGDFFWQLGGINYFPTPLDINEFDQLVQQPGFSSYVNAYSVDMSVTPAAFYVWPAPSGAYPYYGRYHKQQPDITDATSVPWFPSQTYLNRRLTAEMMLITGDTRAGAVLAASEETLKAYMQKEDNRDTRAVKAKLDPRSFGPRWWNLPGTKTVPW